MLAQAREHGFHALALTVDLTWYGNRERDVRNGFTVPPAYTLRQMFEAARRPAWSFDFLANPEYAYAALDVAAATRARRAAAAPPGAPPEPDFPADRRAQVSFIRDAFDPSFNWDDAEWLCQEWGDRGPVALKGVVRPSDAVKAVDRGFDAVWVSNHGGRQLETAPATVDVLSSVRAALGGAEEWAAAKAAEEEARDAWAAKEANAGAAAVATAGTTASTIDRPVSRADSHVSSCAAKAAVAAVAAAAPSAAVSAKTGLPVEVIADGGVQRGTDILKLLALGADGVAVGKPYLYGLCAGGEAGVHKAMDVLRVELERAMGLLGVGTVGELRERMARGRRWFDDATRASETFRTGAREGGDTEGVSSECRLGKSRRPRSRRQRRFDGDQFNQSKGVYHSSFVRFHSSQKKYVIMNDDESEPLVGGKISEITFGVLISAAKYDRWSVRALSPSGERSGRSLAPWLHWTRARPTRGLRGRACSRAHLASSRTPPTRRGG